MTYPGIKPKTFQCEIQHPNHTGIGTTVNLICNTKIFSVLQVVIITHHPPCNWDQIVTYTWMFEELMVEYGDLVTMHVSGHSHNDEFRVVRAIHSYSNTLSHTPSH